MMESLEAADLCFPQLLNTSCRKTSRPHSEVVFGYFMLFSIFLVTVTLNLLVIISITHYRQLHTNTNYILLSLAVSDFIVGFLMLVQMSLIDGCWFLGDFACTVYGLYTYTVTTASIGHMVLISVDRYVAVCDPLHYPTKITATTVRTAICLCWIFSFVSSCVCLKDILEQPGRFNTCTGECVIFISYVAVIVDLFLSFISPVTVIVVLYVRVFVVVVSQVRSMRSHITVIKVQGSVRVTPQRAELKAARTLGIVIVVFLMCTCPYFCVILSGPEVSLNASSEDFIVSLFYFNSCLNPVIYVTFYPWFRQCVKHIVTLQILKHGSCDFSVTET